MRTFFRRNSAETERHLLKLGDRHADLIRNMIKARLRMCEAI